MDDVAQFIPCRGILEILELRSACFTIMFLYHGLDKSTENLIIVFPLHGSMRVLYKRVFLQCETSISS